VFDIDERLRQAVAFGQEVQGLYLRRLLEAQQGGIDRILGFASFRHYARERLGLSPTRKDALLRVQRGLADLPEVAEAYATGVLTLSQVEEVVRVATTQTAPAWVAYARNTTVRKLRDVVKHGKRLQVSDPGTGRDVFPPELKPVEGVLETVFPQLAGPAAPPAEPTCAPRVPDAPLPAPVPVTLVMDADQEAFVRPGLAMAKAVVGPHATVAQAIALLVDLFIFEWHATASRAEKTHPVESRDGWRCTTAGCTQKVGLDAHHLHYRSRGGGDEDWNQSTVCRFHHLRGIHEGHVLAQGKAPDDILWALGMRPDGRPTEVFLGDQRLYG
jgi:acetolactate synthase small subunit